MSSAVSFDSSALPAVFQVLPGAFVLLSPGFIIEEISAEFQAQALRPRDQLVGHYLFEVFPDNPLTKEARASHNLRASLEQVLATGQPHQMALQHYDVADPERPGRFVERYWVSRNIPVLDAEGRVHHILHHAGNVTDQVLAEAQLRESQRREQAAQAEAARRRADLDRAFEVAPAAICILTGPDFVFELANPAYQALFPGRALRGRPLLDVLPEFAGHAFYRALRTVSATGQTHQAASQAWPLAQPAAGALPDRYFSYTQQARFDEQGRVDGVFVFAFEVTAQVQASQLVRATIDSSTAMIQVFQAVRDAAGRIVDFRWTLANESAAANYGADLVGQHLLALNPGVVEAGIFDHFVQVVENGQPQVTEYEYHHEQYDGWFEQSVVRLGDGLVSTTTDITAHKLAEEALRHSEERFRAIVTQTTVGIAETQDGRFTYVNDQYCAMTGYPREVLLGKPVGDITHPEEVARDTQRLRQLYATGEPFVVDKRYVRPDGSLLWSLTSVTPIRDAQGRIVRGLAACIDVTDRKQAEEALHVANGQLRRTNAELDTFVYTASHDLKSPITNIEGLLLALRDTLPPAVQHEEVVTHLLGLLDTTVSRFLTTITQLTDIAHLQRLYDAPAELLPLAPLVADVLADLAPQISAAAAQVAVAIPAGLTVSFAPASLRSIVYNLLSNAVKYRDSARPSQVWLRAERQPGAVVLTVQDNGLGLSESQQQRLFGIFQRLHTHVEGTGVGLYMIKRLIENADASIAVSSSLGVGTTFTVSFPA